MLACPVVLCLALSTADTTHGRGHGHELSANDLRDIVHEVHDDVQEVNGSFVLKFSEEGLAEKTLTMFVGEDSIFLRSLWDIPHKGLEDFPVLNHWNSRFSFCKLSLQDIEDKTQVVMHMDQQVVQPAVDPTISAKNFVATSLHIFKTAVAGFDRAYREYYTELAAATAEDEDTVNTGENDQTAEQ
eukprot:TRINITY_DN31326_c0_g1_i1.p1 TRINITY_DN31326_c0_g1~~TRINITY_DN31326_c0_g1_i1.p1  ORF type:complete len:186 (+),score=46.44 TRINITY_DN31326_c0_g1_i1:46-603(+)